jgi:SpoVK/Ycf46/Vps4 family AAA+-type ATPase
MKHISLICTQHQENGRANVSELHAILERIRPEVIFLELPPDAFDQFFNTHIKSNLESTAVRLYREGKNVELVLVDLPESTDQFFNDYEALQTKIDDVGRDSRRLLTWYRNYVHDHGFAYLNSDHCCDMWSKIHSDELAAIQKIGDPSLTRISDLWKKTINLREEEMMRNILQSCNTLSFERAVFLIGAAHRQSIIDKALQRTDASQHNIHWDFLLEQTQ